MAASHQIQLGTEPGKASLYGSAKTAAGPSLKSAVLTLEPYGLTATTDNYRYYLFKGVYKGTYTMTVTHPAHPTFVTEVTVGPSGAFDFTVQ